MLTELALQFNCVFGIPPLPAACQVLIKCILLLRFPGAINLKCCRRMSSSSAPHPSYSTCHPHIAGILHKTCICRGASTWSTHCSRRRRSAAEGSTLCQLLQLELFGQMFEEAKGKQGLWEWRGGEAAVCAQVTQRNALVLLPVMNPNEPRDST